MIYKFFIIRGKSRPICVSLILDNGGLCFVQPAHSKLTVIFSGFSSDGHVAFIFEKY